MKNTLFALVLLLSTSAPAEPKPLEIQGKPALRVLETARLAGAKAEKGEWRVEGKLEISRTLGNDFFSTSYGMKLWLDDRAYPVKRGSIELVDSLANSWPSQSADKNVWHVTAKAVVTAREGNEAATVLLELTPLAQ